MKKDMNLKVTISPAIMIYMGKTKLGVIKFENIKDTGRFLERLRKAIAQIIKEFNDEKKK